MKVADSGMECRMVAVVVDVSLTGLLGLLVADNGIILVKTRIRLRARFPFGFIGIPEVRTYSYIQELSSVGLSC